MVQLPSMAASNSSITRSCTEIVNTRVSIVNNLHGSFDTGMAGVSTQTFHEPLDHRWIESHPPTSRLNLGHVGEFTQSQVIVFQSAIIDIQLCWYLSEIDFFLITRICVLKNKMELFCKWQIKVSLHVNECLNKMICVCIQTIINSCT